MDLMTKIRRNVRFIEHINELAKRGAAANAGNRKLVADDAKDKYREQLSQRAFVRAFGDKVKSVRYSDRADFVGLMVLGQYQGFWVTKDKEGRKLRIVDVDGMHVHLTKRIIPLRRNDSLSNLQRGLLKWVR